MSSQPKRAAGSEEPDTALLSGRGAAGRAKAARGAGGLPRWDAVELASLAFTVLSVVALLLLALTSLRVRARAAAVAEQVSSVRPAASAAAEAAPTQAPSASVRTANGCGNSKLRRPLAALPPASELERAAVDSLAAGHLTEAAQLYRELCEREPKPSVFGEALRILEESARFNHEEATEM